MLYIKKNKSDVYIPIWEMIIKNNFRIVNNYFHVIFKFSVILQYT